MCVNLTSPYSIITSIYWQKGEDSNFRAAFMTTDSLARSCFKPTQPPFHFGGEDRVRSDRWLITTSDFQDRCNYSISATSPKLNKINQDPITKTMRSGLESNQCKP